jgi:hypothetical protein
MEGFLETGKQYAWMEPLLAFRNKLKAYRDDPSKREKWRRHDLNRPRGWEHEAEQVPLTLDAAAENNEGTDPDVLGPFTLSVRMELFRELLKIQKDIGHTLVQEEEISLIRQYWTEDYRVSEEAMYEILESIYGPSKRGAQLKMERQLLESICSDHGIDILLLDRLLDVERGYTAKLRKRGLYGTIEQIVGEWVNLRQEDGNADS